jgi:hypothetical protein
MADEGRVCPRSLAFDSMALHWFDELIVLRDGAKAVRRANRALRDRQAKIGLRDSFGFRCEQPQVVWRREPIRWFRSESENRENVSVRVVLPDEDGRG